jgi:hypothetical protein
MNCRPGQLARIVKVREPNNHLLGCIVQVSRISPLSEQFETTLWEYSPMLYSARGELIVAFADSCLRPLDTPGDDEVDEMVRLVGPAVPASEGAEA